MDAVPALTYILLTVLSPFQTAAGALYYFKN
jgi:hypothetical protein